MAVPGNHDHWLGIEKVKEALIAGGVHWLPDQPYSLCRDDVEILRFASLVSDSRAAMSTSLAKPSCPLVIVAHDPADFPKAQHAGADLVLAGHLHGCQWVLAKREERLLPGQWFYRWNVLRAEAGGAKLIVSRGCGDTLPVRWNCPREVVCCDLIPSSSIV